MHQPPNHRKPRLSGAVNKAKSSLPRHKSPCWFWRTGGLCVVAFVTLFMAYVNYRLWQQQADDDRDRPLAAKWRSSSSGGHSLLAGSMMGTTSSSLQVGYQVGTKASRFGQGPGTISRASEKDEDDPLSLEGVREERRRRRDELRGELQLRRGQQQENSYMMMSSKADNGDETVLGKVSSWLGLSSTSSNTIKKRKRKRQWSKLGSSSDGLTGDYAVVEMSPAALARAQRHRLQQWQQEGVFYNYSALAIPNQWTLPEPLNLSNVADDVVVNDRKKETTSTAMTNATLAVIVLSGRYHFEKRQAIRSTWAQPSLLKRARSTLLFVIGGPSSNTTTVNNPSNQTPEQTNEKDEEQLRLEFQQHNGDLLDCIHPDSYQSLPYKLHYAYTWLLTKSSSSLEWILKVDDDTFVTDLQLLQRLLLRPLNPDTPLVIGNIIPHSKVPRQGKWAEFVYPHNHYPFWPKGSCGHVVSLAVARALVFGTDQATTRVSSATLTNAASSQQPAPTRHVLPLRKDLVYYQGEDTTLGIWLSQEASLQEKVVWIKTEYFVNHRQCSNFAIVIGHSWTPREMRDCWDVLLVQAARSQRRKSSPFQLSADEEDEEEEHLIQKQQNLWFTKTYYQRRREELLDVRADSPLLPPP